MNKKTKELLAVETAGGFGAGLLGALFGGHSWWFVLLAAGAMVASTLVLLALVAQAERKY